MPTKPKYQYYQSVDTVYILLDEKTGRGFYTNKSCDINKPLEAKGKHIWRKRWNKYSRDFLIREGSWKPLTKKEALALLA